MIMSPFKKEKKYDSSKIQGFQLSSRCLKNYLKSPSSKIYNCIRQMIKSRSFVIANDTLDKIELAKVEVICNSVKVNVLSAASPGFGAMGGMNRRRRLGEEWGIAP